MKLFTVETTTKECFGCKDVTFGWFYEGSRTTRRPYERLIEHYDPSEENTYAEGCIDEFFTAVEAAALKSYLDREHGNQSVTTIKPVKLPIPNNAMGLGARAVGGGEDFYTLSEEQGYSLPFKVWGYFNLVGCELINGSDIYHHRLLLLSPNGKARMQTNAEAAAMLVDDECPF